MFNLRGRGNNTWPCDACPHNAPSSFRQRIRNNCTLPLVAPVADYHAPVTRGKDVSNNRPRIDIPVDRTGGVGMGDQEIAGCCRAVAVTCGEGPILVRPLKPRWMQPRGCGDRRLEGIREGEPVETMLLTQKSRSSILAGARPAGEEEKNGR